MATMSFLGDLLVTVTERSRFVLDRVMGSQPALATRPLIGMAHDLLSGRGEASGVVLASALLTRYATLSRTERAGFLKEVAVHFGPDPVRLDAAIAAYASRPSRATMAAIHHAAEPRSQELIRRLNLAPGGTLALVRMREDLFEHMDGIPALESLDRDFVHLFSSWFNRGFLVLRGIDWRSPAHILERVIRYEAVHAISGWDALRRRLEPPDRRCFAFFHPALVDEPLIFVEVALTRDVPDAIEPIIGDAHPSVPPQEATTAVFYSISNCQEGLRGVSFGNFLIKQVVEELRRDVPTLKTFVTLSPVPGFARWLATERAEPDLLSPDDAAALDALDRPGWHDDPARREALRRPLMQAAGAYFLVARSASGRPLDPVARFHLGNGAELDRIHAFADLSERALRQSFGVMVNYRYNLDAIEKNHETYANARQVVASAGVRKLLKAERTGRAAATERPALPAPPRAPPSETQGSAAQNSPV